MNYKLITGDCRDALGEITPGSVQCVVSSPPYFGLRDYGHPGQVGQEQTPSAYVANLVAVFRSVWKVLADDGTLWLNLGDSYASAWAVNRRNVVGAGSLANGKRAHRPNRLVEGLKEKDLIGIPWRVAFALQDDGWYLRSDVIWHKPNPMPESVTDRPTKAHEYLFLLTKQARYYYDADAIREPHVTFTPESKMNGGRNHIGKRNGTPESGKNTGSTNCHDGRWDQAFHPQGRNKRSVWTIPTRPYKGAHFATMPPALVEPCVLAGSRPGDTILDPFAGSGTVGAVALQHGRRFVGVELNPDYIKLAEQRIGAVALQPNLLEQSA